MTWGCSNHFSLSGISVGIQGITYAYLFNRSQVYASEGRWRESPFWRRRTQDARWALPANRGR